MERRPAPDLAALLPFGCSHLCKMTVHARPLHTQYMPANWRRAQSGMAEIQWGDVGRESISGDAENKTALTACVVLDSNRSCAQRKAFFDNWLYRSFAGSSLLSENQVGHQKEN